MIGKIFFGHESTLRSVREGLGSDGRPRGCGNQSKYRSDFGRMPIYCPYSTQPTCLRAKKTARTRLERVNRQGKSQAAAFRKEFAAPSWTIVKKLGGGTK